MKLLLVHSGNSVAGDSRKYTFVLEQGTALQQLGCEVEYYAVVGKGVRGYLRNVKPLRKKIEEFQPDIVHAHYGLCGMVAVLAVRKKVPVVITCHNGETLTKYGNIISSFAVRKAAYTIYVEQHIRDLSYYKAKNYSIIPCGVPMEEMTITRYAEARKQLGWSDDKKYILFGGAFGNLRKNYKLLKEAVERLAISDERLGNIEVVEMRGFSRAECVLSRSMVHLRRIPRRGGRGWPPARRVLRPDRLLLPIRALLPGGKGGPDFILLRREPDGGGARRSVSLSGRCRRGHPRPPVEDREVRRCDRRPES